MESKEKKSIKFADIQDEIYDALKDKKIAHIKEPVRLLYGFIEEPFRKEITNELIIGGGPTVPMVMLLGEESGQLYLFALKAILPHIEI